MTQHAPDESSKPPPASGDIVALEASERAARRSIAAAAGVIAGPLYIVGVFLVLDTSLPTAIGTYSFLIGGPAALSVLVAVITKAAFPRTLGITLGGIVAVSGVFYATGLESGLCLVVLLAPFLVVGALVSMALSLSNLAKVRAWRARARTLTLLILLAPLPGAVFEDRYVAGTTARMVESSVTVAADPATVWHGVVEVAPFSERELPPTWLQRLGVPRPVYATVDVVNGKSTRLGHFEDGLTFRESIDRLVPERELALFIESVDYPANTRSVVAHALSEGFTRIGVVRYRITPMGKSVTLTLSCSYSVHTTVVPYAEFVGDVVIRSFQHELLRALAARFERRAPDGGAHLVAELQ